MLPDLQKRMNAHEARSEELRKERRVSKSICQESV